MSLVVLLGYIHFLLKYIHIGQILLVSFKRPTSIADIVVLLKEDSDIAILIVCVYVIQGSQFIEVILDTPGSKEIKRCCHFGDNDSLEYV